MADKNDRPNKPNRATKDMAADLEIVRDVSRGTSLIRARHRRYLPQAPAEESSDYKIKLDRAVFFNAFARTVAALTGLVFRREPILGEDVPDEIKVHAENIDQHGTHLNVFLKDLFADSLEAGHTAILIDAPRIPDGRRLSLGQERAGNVRPFWVHIQAEQIVSWRTVVEGAVERLSQVVLREAVIQPDGEFGEEHVERFRVYRRIFNPQGMASVIWSVLEMDGDSVLTMDKGVVANVTDIPLVPIYSRKVGFLESIPPLIDLAHTNIAAYQVQADSLHALSMASSPILVLKGVAADKEVEVGPNRALILPDPGSDATYIETSGSALEAGRQQLVDFKSDMAILGLSMLHRPSRSQETAEAKRLDKSEQDSSLATAARSLQDGVEVALSFHAQMIGLPEGGSISISRDFEALSLTSAELKVFSDLVLAGQLSQETMWSIMAEANALPDDFDIELEFDRIGDLLPPEPVTEE